MSIMASIFYHGSSIDNQEYSSVIFQTEKSNWDSNSVQIPRIKKLEVVNGDGMVTGRCVLKEPSTYYQISLILDILDWNLMLCPEQVRAQTKGFRNNLGSMGSEQRQSHQISPQGFHSDGHDYNHPGLNPHSRPTH